MKCSSCPAKRGLGDPPISLPSHRPALQSAVVYAIAGIGQQGRETLPGIVWGATPCLRFLLNSSLESRRGSKISTSGRSTTLRTCTHFSCLASSCSACAWLRPCWPSGGLRGRDGRSGLGYASSSGLLWRQAVFTPAGIPRRSIRACK